NQIFRFRINEQRFFVFVKKPVEPGGGVAKCRRELQRHDLAQVPSHSGKEIRFSRTWRPEDGQEQRLEFKKRPGDFQVTVRTRQAVASKALCVKSLGLRRKSSGKESLLLVRTEPRVSG